MNRLTLGILTLAACSPSGGPSANCIALDPPDSSYVRCLGSFLPGGAAALCPLGYSPAFGPMPASLAEACQSPNLGGFFAVDVGSWSDAAQPFTGMATCTPGGNRIAGLMGCGDEPGTLSPATCSGWSKSILCSRSQSWTCPNGSLRDAANANPRHGIICSKS